MRDLNSPFPVINAYCWCCFLQVWSLCAVVWNPVCSALASTVESNLPLTKWPKITSLTPQSTITIRSHSAAPNHVMWYQQAMWLFHLYWWTFLTVAKFLESVFDMLCMLWEQLNVDWMLHLPSVNIVFWSAEFTPVISRCLLVWEVRMHIMVMYERLRDAFHSHCEGEMQIEACVSWNKWEETLVHVFA